MPGVYRSSINLTRWRGAVPNALNAGRVDAFFGAGAIADVQAGVAKETSVQTGNTGINSTNSTLAGYMPYLPQIDGRVLTILNNGAQQSTTTATKAVVDGIAANGAQQSTLAATQGTVNQIAANGAQQSTLVATQNAVNGLSASTNVGTWGGVAVRPLVNGRLDSQATVVIDKTGYDTSFWRDHQVSAAVTVNGYIPAYLPSSQANTVTISSLLDAMTIEETLALEAMAEQQTDAGRLARIFFRRLLVNTIVDVEPVRALAERLRPLLVTAGVWRANTAAARVAAWFTPPKTVAPPTPPPKVARPA